MFGNIDNSIIVCYDRLVDREPESHSQRLDSISDVEGCIEVGVAGVPTVTTEEPCGSGPDVSASAARLAGVGRRYPSDNDAFLHGFVFEKGLQLCKSPRVQLPVESSAFVFADMLYVLHSENVAMFKPFNDFLAHLMVGASHESCPSAREPLEMPLGGLRTFALQGSDERLVLSHLRDDTAVESAIRRNGKVLYSDIDAQNSPMSSRAKRHVNVFGKAKMKEGSVLLVNCQYAFPDVPSLILGCVAWHLNREFLATMDSGNAEDAVLVGEAPRRIVFHKSSLDNRPALGFLDHSAGLLDASTGELRMKAENTNMFVGQCVKYVRVLDMMFPGSVNTVLERICINRNSFADGNVMRQSQTNHSTRHDYMYGQASLNSFEVSPFLHPLKWVASWRREL